MLNYNVFCLSQRKTLVPWTIDAVNPPNLTFRQFLTHKVDLQVPTPRVLDSTFVGRSKDALDNVCADLPVHEVVQTFGPFVKYLVKEINCSREIQRTEGINAFQVLMASAREQSHPRLPPLIPEPRNKKDVLRNDVIGLLSLKTPRLPPETFSKICFLPDPVPKGDDHYKPFSDVYSTKTSEEFRPSLAKRGKTKTLPFSASVQHVRNVNLMLQCEECGMWRLLYSPRKLSPTLRTQLSVLMEDFTYTCGAALSDLELPEALSSVCVRDIQCHAPLEKLYYSMNYNPICIHCCGETNLTSKEGCYPHCELCTDKPQIKKRT